MAADTAADLAEDLRGAARPFIDDLVSRVSFLLLAVLLVPAGIAVVALGFVAMALTFEALGSPTGPVASAISLVGLLGILAALFLSLRTLYRRMPRRLRAGYAGPMAPDPANRIDAAFEQLAVGGTFIADSRPRDVPVPTLAELDERLRPRAERPDER